MEVAREAVRRGAGVAPGEPVPRLRPDQFKEASRERFFAMTNHELRNALTAVAGWTELWIRKTSPDTPRAAIEVQESAERALEKMNRPDLVRRIRALRPLLARHWAGRAG